LGRSPVSAFFFLKMKNPRAAGFLVFSAQSRPCSGAAGSPARTAARSAKSSDNLFLHIAPEKENRPSLGALD